MDAGSEEVAFRLKKGELSAVIRTKEGFEILRLEEARKVQRPEYARAEPRIRAILASRESEARRAAFHEELWAKYGVKEPRVEWSLDALKAAVTNRSAIEVGSWVGGS